MNGAEKNAINSENRSLRVYDEQVARIREKLALAAQSPGAKREFGAEEHQYRLNEPLTTRDLDRLERDWGIALPDAFAVFLTGVGDGGPGRTGGAGPYYGIYATESMKPDKSRLGQPAVFELCPQTQDWMAEAPEEYVPGEDLDDEAYDEAIADLLRGTLEIGTMGCSWEIRLIVAGEHRGRVLYMDTEYQKPFFVYEKNFLDWYERWLDEVIAGFEIHWFGTTPGGSEQTLLEMARSDEAAARGEALKALLRLPQPGEESIRLARQALADPADGVRYWALTLLAKHAPDLADPLLMAGLNSGKKEERRTAAQLIHWYCKPQAGAFAEAAQRLVPVEEDEETFRFLGYLLEAAGVDPLPLLLPVYERLLEQHPTDEHDIPVNVRHRLREYELHTPQLIERGVPAGLPRVRIILREMMEESR
ncbi:SMI1/KNR4 family protein [Saccharibacillus sp. CPCC 101409]|uniref:HEAT repeat domain-containing protein n=1 Tax=Saccharibacillus sp. CPCC 101409 TaxID=3058041 RepID=UPI0026715DD5|nr:SMI1/KNR4 family protein [Saccharibacillus sp. CPCC 101409]MDO3411909.1 SMI1/KNR4 family protein [Saccharibacillus sp. CPCC 101409]